MEEQNTIEQEAVEQPTEQVTQEAPQEAPFKVYDSAEEMLAAQQPQPQAEPEVGPMESAPQPSMETQAAPTQPEPRAQYTEQDVETAVSQYLSERLGREVTNIDELFQPQAQTDERVEAISRFVQETGRSPQDWFTYQSFDTSNMDDLMAVRVKMATDHPNLNSSEINLLLSKKYALDPDTHSEEEIQLGTLQLKMDASEAKKGIETMRESYKAPEPQQAEEPQEFIDEQWINQMVRDTSALEGLEFDLGQDKTFTFGLTSEYKNDLMDRNAKLDEFFDPYVDDNGNWDFDMLSSHRAVIDNIDNIVRSAYQQGMSDGQRNVVSRAANVQSVAPTEQTDTTVPDRIKTLRDHLRSQSSVMTFNA